MSARIIPTAPGRSWFDAYRWRCEAEGTDSCGVWRSAVSYEEAVRGAAMHDDEGHGDASR